jgi:hypothetical protein
VEQRLDLEVVASFLMVSLPESDIVVLRDHTLPSKHAKAGRQTLHKTLKSAQRKT